MSLFDFCVDAFVIIFIFVIVGFTISTFLRIIGDLL